LFVYIIYTIYIYIYIYIYISIDRLQCKPLKQNVQQQRNTHKQPQTYAYQLLVYPIVPLSHQLLVYWLHPPICLILHLTSDNQPTVQSVLCIVLTTIPLSNQLIVQSVFCVLVTNILLSNKFPVYCRQSSRCPIRPACITYNHPAVQSFPCVWLTTTLLFNQPPVYCSQPPR
jgi:hypothetical protein